MTYARLHIAVAATVTLLAAAAPASAQGPLTNPAENPGKLVREAFASPYGRAMAAEFNAVLRASADAACLQSKNLSPEQLARRGEALIVARSIKATEAYASFINISIYDTKLAQSAGIGAAAEVARLEQNPDVKRYLAIERPRRQALLLDYLFENLSRYALIHRIKLGQVSPLATGNEALMRANPTDTVEAEREQFLATSKSAQLSRYLDLSEQRATALRASFNTEAVRNSFSPAALFGGIEKDLAELCVPRP
jgi:hypothetical protein